MNLDHEVPIGDPTALLCRWGHGPKSHVSGALMCHVCDGLGYVLARRNA